MISSTMIHDTDMPTVNSISGGKSSAYLALHYPADYNIFALVCVDDHNAGSKKIDPAIKRIVNERLQKSSPGYEEFRATTEDPLTLKAMLDLEQMMGREIVWVRGMSWETMLAKQKAIPNKFMRFCTTILKIWPIFQYIYLNVGFPVRERIGYRYEEKERANTFNETIKFSFHCDLNRKIHRWETIKYRVGEFPLIEDKTTHYRIAKFWKSKSIIWPKDSNCLNCFWKNPQQLRRNFDSNPGIMAWAGIMEVLFDHTFNDQNSLFEIARLGIQLDFFEGAGSGCQSSGYCIS